MSDQDSRDKPKDAPQPGTFPEVMTIAEAARYLQLAEQVLYRHVRAGTVPASRLGKTIRFKKSILDAWLEESAWKTMGRTPPKKVSAAAARKPVAGRKLPQRKADSGKKPRRRRPPRREFRVELD